MRPSLRIDLLGARRLALHAAGLLRPEWSDLSPRGRGRGPAARESALRLIRHLGYHQLDTVSVAGARSHALVLLSRFPRIDAELGEELLLPGEPLFEYWGHEASWMPLDLYPAFQFRRDRMRRSEWWRGIQERHPGMAGTILSRVRDEGPIRSADLDGEGRGGWWGHKPAKRVVVALWSSGELAVRERRAFQRTFDLAERVIPDSFRGRPMDRAGSLRALMRLALRGHGWATTGTLADTWRLRNLRSEIVRALSELEESREIAPCTLEPGDGSRPVPGWIHRDYVDRVERLRRLRPNPEHVVLLSPFDPVLWDRKRVRLLFGFEQTLEIFKPAAQREYGYFCLPALAGDRLIGRVDPKAERKDGRLRIVAEHVESRERTRAREEQDLLRRGVRRLATQLGLEPIFPGRSQSRTTTRSAPKVRPSAKTRTK